MRQLISIALATLFFSMLSAQEISIPEPTGHNSDEAINEAIHRRAIALEVMRGLAPIKSRQGLVAHLMAHSKDNASPLHQLSEGGLQSFLDSLVFTDLGLGSYSSKPLVEELSSTEIYPILKLFGVQYNSPLLDDGILSEVDKFVGSLACDGDGFCLNPGDRVGWECIKRATCKEASIDLICTANC